MNKDKVYIEGYEVGFSVGTIGNREKKIQVSSGEIVSIDENFIYKSIEPKKVKVPPFVSVWYRINKDNLYKNIAYLCANWEKSTNDDTLFNWMSNTDNFVQILVNMHQFGYEIEKEKQYLVKIKATKHYLVKDGNGKIIFSLAFKGYFTKKELEEAEFGWVFDCPGIEIEEVE